MNIPGIATIEFIEEKNISIPFVSDPDAVIVPTLLNNATWEKLNALQGSVGLKSSERDSNAGIYFNVSVSGFYSGISTANRQILTRVSMRKHIFRLTDVNGVKYLVGTNAFRPKFLYNSTNGPTPTGQRGYNFSISLKSKHDVLFTE